MLLAADVNGSQDIATSAETAEEAAEVEMPQKIEEEAAVEVAVEAAVAADGAAEVAEERTLLNLCEDCVASFVPESFQLLTCGCAFSDLQT